MLKLIKEETGEDSWTIVFSPVFGSEVSATGKIDITRGELKVRDVKQNYSARVIKTNIVMIQGGRHQTAGPVLWLSIIGDNVKIVI